MGIGTRGGCLQATTLKPARTEAWGALSWSEWQAGVWAENSFTATAAGVALRSSVGEVDYINFSSQLLKHAGCFKTRIFFRGGDNPLSLNYCISSNVCAGGTLVPWKTAILHPGLWGGCPASSPEVLKWATIRIVVIGTLALNLPVLSLFQLCSTTGTALEKQAVHPDLLNTFSRQLQEIGGGWGDWGGGGGGKGKGMKLF